MKSWQGAPLDRFSVMIRSVKRDEVLLKLREFEAP